MKKISLAKLTESPMFLKDSWDSFICCSSFESRCAVIPVALAQWNFKKAFVLESEIGSMENAKNQEIICKSFGEKIVPKLWNLDKPIISGRTLNSIVEELRVTRIKSILVDITTFTHELLLILLKNLFLAKSFFERISFLYLPASDYSIGDDVEKKWLTKGCKEVRNVLGYPGLLIPGLPNSLIVLLGFEFERATRMITELDPEKVYLGSGIPLERHVTAKRHLPSMVFFQRIVGELVAKRGNIEKFKFCCRGISGTMKTLKEIISSDPECNHIIVPMNTKISTIAAGLVAIENPKIQVCYSQPEVYNRFGYSKPGNQVYKFDLR